MDGNTELMKEIGRRFGREAYGFVQAVKERECGEFTPQVLFATILTFLTMLISEEKVTIVNRKEESVK